MAELRIGDGERESAVAALGEHYAQGRLTKDEYDERSDAAWAARTAGDLRPLFADLPASTAGPVTRPPGSGATATAPPPRRQVPWKALLVGLAVLGVLTNGKLVLVALLLWFVLARHRGVSHPPWVHRGPGGTPPPPWGQQPPPWGPPPGGRGPGGPGGHGR